MHILVKGAILPCYIHRAIFTIYYWCIFHICLYFCLGCLVEILKILKEFLVFCGANSVADTFCSIFFFFVKIRTYGLFGLREREGE